MPHSRIARVLRGFAAASVATFVALWFHVASGGNPPSWLGILVPLMLSFTGCVLLSGVRASLVRTGLSVSLAQFLFHALFSLGALGGTSMPSGHMHSSSAMVMPVGQIGAHQDSTMWIGHAVAALLTTFALYRGDVALAALRELSGFVLRSLRTALEGTFLIPTPMSGRVTLDGEAPRAAYLSVSLFSAPLRGPPVLLV